MRPAPAPALRIRGRHYPIVLPRRSDPRLHLAAVIFSLHALGQAAFGFRLSIAQILVALATCALLELAITFRRQRAIVWPASALLTGNGVAFVLRVPGTEHGDWWSLRGAWIYSATAAIALLSKYVIRLRGRHLYNPSNFGLVVCLLVLGSSRVEPLDFWWGQTSLPLVAALVLIVGGGFAILARLRLLAIALVFWVAFAAALLPIAATGHGFSARWHLGPVQGFRFWWVLVTSPEILVFLFFMITDPKTVPAARRARLGYSCAIAVVAAALVAPAQTEFGAKLGVLAALAIVCPLRPLLERVLPDRPAPRRWRLAAPAIAAAAAGLAAIAAPAPGIAGPSAAAGRALASPPMPAFTIAPNDDVPARISAAQGRAMAGDVALALAVQQRALERRDRTALAAGAAVAWRVKLEERLARSGRSGPLRVAHYRLTRLTLTLARRPGQGAPAVMAVLHGGVSYSTWGGRPLRETHATSERPLLKAFEIARVGARYLIVSDVVPLGWRPS